MASLKKLLEHPSDAPLILQGNLAFALGVVHGGIHAADGYPGTPSTEILDHLRQVRDNIIAEWSINEAVAVGVGLGYAVAGHDAVVTMKVPGLFQAADVVASAAFSKSFSGGLVLFIATDHAPSSTQYLVDARHFLSSLHLPILEPRDHQDVYQSAARAADLSRRYATPVAIVCSSVLCHSEGIITPVVKRVTKRAPLKTGVSKVLLPNDARRNFIHAVQHKMPKIRGSAMCLDLTDTVSGNIDWGIIACGEASLIVKEILSAQSLNPHQCYLGMTHPLPIPALKKWAEKVNGPIYLVEDGERFVETQLRQNDINIIGKEGFETTLHWTPDILVRYLSVHHCMTSMPPANAFDGQPLKRSPALCPGCPYKAVSLAIQKLKQQNKLDLVFGDIGCSTLLHFQNALDINLCMGASESMRQGFVLSKPHSANRVVSLIGDSSECHSGLDASRNAIIRNTPGLKIILDNGAIAMTGGQASPTRKDSSGHKKIHLDRILQAEGAECMKLNAYNNRQIWQGLNLALERATTGRFISVIIEGECIGNAKRASKKGTRLVLNTSLCTKCGRCNFCPAIDHSAANTPSINGLCTRCGSGRELCVQQCASGALSIESNTIEHTPKKQPARPPCDLPAIKTGIPTVNDWCAPYTQIQAEPPMDTTVRYTPDGLSNEPQSPNIELPERLRVLTCGVGGQGNLFLGKVLAQVIQSTAYMKKNIIKGEIHGMAQKGGCVSSTFACGDVYSPIFPSQSVDIMIAMERNEALRPAYLNLLKPNAIIILNNYSIIPAGVNRKTLPTGNQILQKLSGFQVIPFNPEKFTHRNTNAAILGRMSTLFPFSTIPKEQWNRAFEDLSKNPAQVRRNVTAFSQGRKTVECETA